MTVLYCIGAFFLVMFVLVIFALMKVAAIEDERMEEDEMISVQLEIYRSMEENTEKKE